MPTTGPTPPYTQAELDELRSMVCNEIAMIQQVDTSLFAPLNSLFELEQTDGILDLSSSENIVHSYVDSNPTVSDLDPLGIASESSYLLGDIVTVSTGSQIGELLSLGGSALGLANELRRTNTTSASSVIDGQTELAASDLYQWIGDHYASTAAGMTDIESIVDSDPVKLAAVDANVGGNGVWELQGLSGSSFSDVTSINDQQLLGQARLGAIRYIYTHLIGSTSADQKCSLPDGNVVYTNPLDPPTDFDLGQAGSAGVQPFAVLTPSLGGISSDDAKTLGAFMFGDGGPSASQSVATGQAPAGASIPPRTFFVQDLGYGNTCTALTLADLDQYDNDVNSSAQVRSGAHGASLARVSRRSTGHGPPRRTGRARFHLRTGGRPISAVTASPPETRRNP